MIIFGVYFTSILLRLITWSLSWLMCIEIFGGLRPEGDQHRVAPEGDRYLHNSGVIHFYIMITSFFLIHPVVLFTIPLYNATPEELFPLYIMIQLIIAGFGIILVFNNIIGLRHRNLKNFYAFIILSSLIVHNYYFHIDGINIL